MRLVSRLFFTLPYPSQRPDRPMFCPRQSYSSTPGTQLFPILDLNDFNFEFLMILDLMLSPFLVENWSFSKPKIILLLSRSLTSYKNATWRIYCKYHYIIKIFNTTCRHIIIKSQQIDIRKPKLLRVSSFGSLFYHFWSPKWLQTEPKIHQK